MSFSLPLALGSDVDNYTTNFFVTLLKKVFVLVDTYFVISIACKIISLFDMFEIILHCHFRVESVTSFIAQKSFLQQHFLFIYGKTNTTLELSIIPPIDF